MCVFMLLLSVCVFVSVNELVYMCVYTNIDKYLLYMCVGGWMSGCACGRVRMFICLVCKCKKKFTTIGSVPEERERIS